MSTIISTPMVIPKNPTKNRFIFDRKPSKLRFVSSINGDATRLIRSCSLQYCKSGETNCSSTQRRRSGNYKPSLWDFDFVQSLSSEYTEEKYLKRVDELVVQVNLMLDEEIMEPIKQLELIDDLNRLCISRHFEDKINHILNRIYNEHKYNSNNYKKDLNSTSLEFRLLRQHGFSVSQDVFDCFKNDKGNFEPSLSDDTKGLLQLYEASFMLKEGENTLEQAKEFAYIFLLKQIDDEGNNGIVDEHLSILVRNALELPLHWRIQKPNSRWFINAYSRKSDMIPSVLELAKLDFNIVQATHQEELKVVSSWWKETCLAEKMPFARDRLVECYFWTIGYFFEPQYGYARMMATKFTVFITIIDDMFDVYGTIEELQLFYDVIRRWNVEAIDKLPNYMQICFLALNNFINEMAYNVLREQGFLIIPYLRKSWTDLCRVYLQEAMWYSKGYTPTFEEYIRHAWISISAPVVLSHAFFLMTNPIDKEVVQSLYEYHNIVQCSSMILRLANDLGTSQDEMKRGDVPKSVECYMNETGASIEEAREYVKLLIYSTWKKMNEERVANSSFEQQFVRSAVNLGRTAQYVYQYGDGHGVHSFPEMKARISNLLFEPIV